MSEEQTISVAVLCGGQSSRMGRNKAFVEVGGLPVIERVITQVRPLTDDLLLITNTHTEYATLGLPTYPDLLTGKGPLGGLYTALSHARHSYLLLVSCDQPFLNRDLLRYLISLRSGVDVVVPLARDGYPQSMHAVYGKGCLPAIEAQIAADRLKMIGFFSQVRVREAAGDEIDRFDPERLSFTNLNTPDDLAAAQRIAAHHGR